MNQPALISTAKLLNKKANATDMPPLVYMTDEIRDINPLTTIDQLPIGCGVIFRHYNYKNRRQLAFEIKKISLEKKLKLIIASDYNLAQEIDADGLHLPEYQMKNPPIKALLWHHQPNKILTGAAHSLRALKVCQKFGIDAALLSPIFPTASHPETSQKSFTIGFLKMMSMCLNSDLPIYALGGINQHNARRLLNSRVIGIAGISALSGQRTHE